ncbi:Transcription factor [Mycena sanguinolenta]|uniref:Transcription factor n=1 Tax=Mycena sanguinolenta TaxID=230812 RepID=A0A8H7D9K9_9AGAR|nr:Transcription factor [Mycena sanguinolenta]
MPVHRTVPPRRSRKPSVRQPAIRDDGSDGDLQLLYPDSGVEGDPPSNTADASPAPTAHRAHSRRRSAHHIPRPPNCFLCFRTYFCQLNNERADGVRDHSVLSRQAGKAWRALSPAEKKKFEVIAREKKILHAQMYPNYTYSPAARTGSKGCPKKRQADDDCDYEDDPPQPKRRKSRARAQYLGLRIAVSEHEDDVSFVRSEDPLSSTATPRSSAPSPELSFTQPLELSPNSSSSKSADPVLCTPALTFSEPVYDDEFVPTSDIPFLDLNAEKIEETKIERLQRTPSLHDIATGSQFFKSDIPSQTRDTCTWHPTYSSDGYILSTPFSPKPSPPTDEYVVPINYDAIQFTNPFSLGSFELEMSSFDHF